MRHSISTLSLGNGLDKQLKMLTLTLISLSLLTQTACAKPTQSQVENSQKLLQQMVGKDCKATSDNNFNCELESLEFSILKQTDLDGDGNIDLIAKEITSGIGSNYSATSLYFILADNQGNLKADHSMVTWSRGAYNTIEVDRIEGNVVYATITPNDIPEHAPYKGDSVNIKFIWKDGLPYESRYLDSCKLAKVTDKNIFKDTLVNSLAGATINRKTTLDNSNYTQSQEESIKNNTMQYRATMYGCDNINLSLHAHGANADVYTVINELIENTRYASVLKQLPADDYRKGVAENNAWYYLEDGWKANINYNSIGANKNVSLNLQKVSNLSEQEGNWNITIREKGL